MKFIELTMSVDIDLVWSTYILMFISFPLPWRNNKDFNSMNIGILVIIYYWNIQGIKSNTYTNNEIIHIVFYFLNMSRNK